MMSRFRCCLLALICLALTARAHPGVGIVVDRQGNVYYTDLVHVWKQTPAGERSIAVRNVHTHELYLDAAGNLYGEHSWYTGEATNQWGYYVWCLQASGRLVKVIPDTEGFWKDYGFARDHQGTMYWMTDVGKQQKIRCKPTQGPPRTLVTGRFGPAHWVTCTPGGTVYFLQGDVLCRLTPTGQFKRLTGHLSQAPIANHALMGLWTDALGRVYVANSRENIIQRVSADGTVRTVAKGSPVWTASGGTVTPSGDLWLLEYSATNAVRVRRIVGGGKL